MPTAAPRSPPSPLVMLHPGALLGVIESLYRAAPNHCLESPAYASSAYYKCPPPAVFLANENANIDLLTSALSQQAVVAAEVVSAVAHLRSTGHHSEVEPLLAALPSGLQRMPLIKRLRDESGRFCAVGAVPVRAEGRKVLGLRID